MSSNRSPRLNSFLGALPPEDFEQLYPALELVSLDHGEVLYGLAPIQYLYFPIDCIICLLNEREDGGHEEIAITGNEGVVGIDLTLAGIPSYNYAIVGAAGSAYRLRHDVVARHFSFNSPLQILLLRYTRVIITQMMYTSICKRRHTLEQQMCRWLLSTLDRMPSMQLRSTQKTIAGIMGADVGSLGKVTNRLQNLGLIYPQSRLLNIINRSQLETLACNCYRTMRNEFDSWLSCRIKTPFGHSNTLH